MDLLFTDRFHQNQKQSQGCLLSFVPSIVGLAVLSRKEDGGINVSEVREAP